MAIRPQVVYVCAHCLKVSAVQEICHDEDMLKCECGAPGDERSRPITVQGRLVTHAPRWWVEACCTRAQTNVQ
ncbi:MAG: hypothetical protein GXP41_06415 [Chloroflexi bacterium]|nr:hypothetical protein [Chloroflexota bacterium]